MSKGLKSLEMTQTKEVQDIHTETRMLKTSINGKLSHIYELENSLLE